ncbi:Aerobic respiration control sensor protein ArcB [compost metagenome]
MAAGKDGRGRDGPNPLLQRYWPLALTVCLGVLISSLLAWRVAAWQRDRERLVFERRASDVAGTIRSTMRAYEEVLLSVRALFAASVDISRRDFTLFTADTLDRLPGILSIAWLPRVAGEQRAAFIAGVRREGVSNYHLWQWTPDGRQESVPVRSEYFPVLYVVPESLARTLLGYCDVFPDRLEAIARARDTGQLSVSNLSPLRLQGMRPGVLMSQAVYAPTPRPATTQARRAQTAGFVMAAFSFERLFTDALRQTDLDGLRFRLIDESAPPEARVLYASKGEDGRSEAAIRAGEHWQRSQMVGGHRWTFLFYPADGAAPWGGWLMLMGGFAVTGLSCLYLHALLSRTAKIEATVVQRTRELSTANERLANALSDREAAERALRESEGKLRAIIDHTTDLIFVKDLQGRYLLANPALAALVGVSPEEMLGKDDGAFFGAEEAAWLMAKDAGIMREGGVSTGEEALTFQEGKPRLFLATKFPFVSPEGKTLGLIGICRDITDYRRSLDDMARRTAEFEQTKELSRLKDHFLSTLSHEMKTPLSLIVGYGELLQDKYQNDPLIAGLMDGCRRLTEHINTMLDYSALLSGSLPLYWTEVDLSEVIAQAYALVEREFEAKRLEWECVIDPATPPVWGDFRRITQILRELLDNARKFTPPGGRVGIHVSPEGEMVRIEVWDTGQGIPPGAHERIWAAFTQIETEDAARAGGLGLGLTIVKQLVELHRGSVSMACRPGEGCRFSVLLPVRPPGG